MGDKIVLQEVTGVQNRFQTSAEELKGALQTLSNKIDSFIAISTFKGKAADSIDSYLTSGHKKLSVEYGEATGILQEQFQKVIEEFQGNVDSASNAIITEMHLEDISKRITYYKVEFDRCNQAAKKTIESINDIVSISYPDSNEISLGVMESIEKVNETLAKFKMFSSKQNDLQSFEEVIKPLEEIVGKIGDAKGNFEDAFKEQGFLERWLSGIKALTGYMDKTDKMAVGLASAATLAYVEKNFGLEFKFDPNAKKGRGAYVFNISQREDMVKVSRFLKGGTNVDGIVELIQNGFTVADSRVTRNARKKAQKELYNLPVFSAHQKFDTDLREKGTFSAVKNRWTGVVVEELKKNMDELNPQKWPGVFKGYGSVGQVMKKAPVVGTILTVGDNVSQSQADGFQLRDVADIGLDTAVDLGYGAGAVATGAVIGTAIGGPIGTAVGAGVGVGIAFLTDVKFEGLGGKSIVDKTKEVVKGTADKITGKIKSIFW